MNYAQMTQLALRGVVRDAIRRVIREDGLPGAHHFYITFLTRYPGVEIDESLAKKYPEEITIVIEHQFWDLTANTDNFEVTLKFGGVPKYLKVPYLAVTRFHDPSVAFALQFDTPKEMEAAPITPNLKAVPSSGGKASEGADDGKVAPKIKTDAGSKAKRAKKKTGKGKTSPKGKETPDNSDDFEPRDIKSEKSPVGKSSTAKKGANPENGETSGEDTGAGNDENKVVSLDSFRKK